MATQERLRELCARDADAGNLRIKWSDTDVIHILELYREREILWNTDLLEYRNKPKRERAYSDLIGNLGIPGVTLTDIKTKIKHIRSSYSLELSKVLQSDDSYVPTLNWFPLADTFLRRVTRLRKNKERKHETCPPSKKVAYTAYKSEFNPRMQQLEKSEESNGVDRSTEVEYGDDEFNVFAKHVAMQLRKLPLHVAIDLQGQIQSMVHQARMTALHEQQFTNGSVHFVTNSD